MPIDQLKKIYSLADQFEINEGRKAYFTYKDMMQTFSRIYNIEFERVVAAFVALSPNNDYFGNLRSLASVLDGINYNKPLDSIKVSTFNHCRDRAYTYANGTVDFLDNVRGKKIRSFYFNITNPYNDLPVTVDGHMKCAYYDRDMTMKEAIIRNEQEYNKIANAIRELAKELNMIPNQLQATIWLTRKRIKNIKYNPFMDMFAAPNNVCGIFVDPFTIKPYPRNK